MRKKYFSTKSIYNDIHCDNLIVLEINTELVISIAELHLH